MRAKVYLGAALAAFLVMILMWVRGRTKPPQPPTPVATVTATSPANTPTTSATAQVPAQRQIAEDIRRLGLTPERAKMLFSMTVGPLPGVSVPAGGRDPGDFDGTQAIAYLVRVWDSLSAEQQKTAAELIHGAPGARAERTPLPRALSTTANFLYFAPNTPAADYKTLASNADGTLGAFLKLPGVEYTVDVDYGTPEGTEYAHTWSFTLGNVAGWDKGCHITFWNQKFLGLDEADAEAIVTHRAERRELQHGQAVDR